MAKPALLPTWRISSTRSSETMPKATAPVEVSTQEVEYARPDDRELGGQRVGSR